MLALLSNFFAAASISAQTPKIIAVRAARMLNVKSGKYINNPVVLIEGERIREAGEKLSIPKM